MVAKQRGEEVHLDHRRVLELVKEDRAEFLAQSQTHSRSLVHNAVGQDQLVGKVQDTHVTLALLIGLDRTEESDTATVCTQQVPRIAIRLAHLLELAPQLLQGLARTLHRVPMFGEFTRQMQDLFHRTQRLEFIVQVCRPRLNDLRHQVDCPRLGEHRKVRVDPDTHTVLGDDALRKGIVGQRHRVLVETLTQLRHLA